jgi:hypothetical protein
MNLEKLFESILREGFGDGDENTDVYDHGRAIKNARTKLTDKQRKRIDCANLIDQAKSIIWNAIELMNDEGRENLYLKRLNQLEIVMDNMSRELSVGFENPTHNPCEIFNSYDVFD